MTDARSVATIQNETHHMLIIEKFICTHANLPVPLFFSVAVKEDVNFN